MAPLSGVSPTQHRYQPGTPVRAVVCRTSDLLTEAIFPAVRARTRKTAASCSGRQPRPIPSSEANRDTLSAAGPGRRSKGSTEITQDVRDLRWACTVNPNALWTLIVLSLADSSRARPPEGGRQITRPPVPPSITPRTREYAFLEPAPRDGNVGFA